MPKLIGFLLVCLLAISSCQSGNQKPEVLLRASLLVNEQHSWYKAFAYFAEQLEERSDGRLRLEVYHSEQLAKEVEAVRLIRAGVIDMTSTSSVLSNWVEIAALCEMPFLLKDTTEMLRLVESPIGKRIEHEIREEVGLRVVGYLQAGARHLTSNRPIKHPDDLNGLIVRVPNIPSFVTAWQACGAKPTPMAFSEVFTALQQGTVEAQENPLALINAQGFAEVQDYINLTAHVISWTYPVIGEKQYQALPQDLRDIFDACAQDMQVYANKVFREEQERVRQELLAAGVTFVEVDKEAFAQKSQQAIYNSLSPAMQKVYDEILALKSKQP
ncbi:TRAP transporter substrate-binding protein [Marinoscillum furvescens]|uniref:Tripartite ATP-independent transporter DctP family solute receptor n=1 Tax=Marinoscillum furvescens DSM 4134 TaxID=1122208 RepID=A0A3D9KZ90_MARFU|nr:TRAP transporter substrate-binding protein [Marinoscillum furvescens]RED93024.1 tripartite ATP-independent transporter DctP family solute receptor [Marinoscillum furvescens DSM 4134]